MGIGTDAAQDTCTEIKVVGIEEEEEGLLEKFAAQTSTNEVSIYGRVFRRESNEQ